MSTQDARAVDWQAELLAQSVLDGVLANKLMRSREKHRGEKIIIRGESISDSDLVWGRPVIRGRTIHLVADAILHDEVRFQCPYCFTIGFERESDESPYDERGRLKLF